MWEAVGVRGERPCGRPIGLYRAREYDPRASLTDFTVARTASLGRVQSASQIGLLWEAVFPDWLTDYMTKCGRPCARESESGRPWEAVLP